MKLYWLSLVVLVMNFVVYSMIGSWPNGLGTIVLGVWMLAAPQWVWKDDE